MNEIEKNRINNEDEAAGFLVPSVIPYPMVPLYKQTLIDMIGGDKLIEKANIMYYEENCDPYINFFMKILKLSGENASIIIMDNTSITFSLLGAKKNAFDDKTYEELMSSVNNTTWLNINHIVNARFYNFVKNWRLSTSYIDEDNRNVFIKLLPTTTTVHLDELYRAMSSYY